MDFEWSPVKPGCIHWHALWQCDFARSVRVQSLTILAYIKVVTAANGVGQIFSTSLYLNSPIRVKFTGTAQICAGYCGQDLGR